MGGKVRMENIEEYLQRRFFLIELSLLLKDLTKKQYLLLVLLIDYARIHNSELITIPLDFIKKNLFDIENKNNPNYKIDNHTKEIDNRTIKRSLKELNKKGFIRYKETKLYLSDKDFKRQLQMHSSNLKYLKRLHEFIRLSDNNKKNVSKSGTLRVEKYQEGMSKFIEKSNQDYLIRFLKRIENLSTKSILKSIENEIDCQEINRKDLIERKKNIIRTKYFEIEFVKEPENIVYDLLDVCRLDSKINLISPLMFAFQDLPINQLLMLLFIDELFDVYNDISKLLKNSVVSKKFSGSTITISKSIIAQALYYDISYVNKTLLALHRRKLIAVSNSYDSLDVSITFNHLEIEKNLLDKKHKELQKIQTERSLLNGDYTIPKTKQSNPNKSIEY